MPDYSIDKNYKFPGGRCAYCGSNRLIQDEHVRAEVSGGEFTIPACMQCNTSKGKKTLKSWLRWIRLNDRYRWGRITSHHMGRSNWLSKLIHEIQRE